MAIPFTYSFLLSHLFFTALYFYEISLSVSFAFVNCSDTSNGAFPSVVLKIKDDFLFRKYHRFLHTSVQSEDPVFFSLPKPYFYR